MNLNLTTANKNWHATGALIAAILALTISPLFVRWADAPGVITSFYRMLIAGFILTPITLITFKKYGFPNKKALLFPVLAGIFTALDHGLWATSIENTTIANATLLNNISPLWVALFALLVWKEKLGFRFWLGLIVVILGASAVLGSTIIFRPEFVSGDFLALASSFFYAGFYLVTQRGRVLFNTLTFLWIMLLSAMICILIYVLLKGIPIFGYSLNTYLLFISAALISQLAGYFLITYALGKLPASVVTPSMVAQPVLTALIAIPLAGERLLIWQFLGGLLSMVGIYVINREKRGTALE